MRRLTVMAEPSRTSLDHESYVNLETFRKDGSGVKTPVWVAPLDGRLVIVTDGTSHKVKRLLENPRCKVAASDARGNVKGPWYDAQAVVIADPARKARAIAALRKKYGWQIRMLDLASWLSRRIGRRAILEVEISG